MNTAELELEPIANNQTIVHISKVDAETGEELPGATLELFCPDGDLIETWESTDIPHVITGMPVGEGYVLKETAAPEGYQLAEDITFAVAKTAEIQFVGMVDETSPEEPAEPDAPETPAAPAEPAEPRFSHVGGSGRAIGQTPRNAFALCERPGVGGLRKRERLVQCDSFVVMVVFHPHVGEAVVR